MMIPDKFATVVPLIIATDKTQLSVMCGGQQAYPVYLTIGNLPKSVRRKVNRHATVLLGYLPADEFTEVADLDERAWLKHQLTHDALAILMAPLKNAARNGITMPCTDGRQRRVYPIPAAFEGDWPEQCGMACADEGGCPVCEQVYDLRSHYPNLASPRNPNDTLAALRAYLKNDKDPGELKPLRLKPWWPWWASIPYMNFHASIMPDLLHQLYQGMIKTHIITWTKKVVGVHVVDKCFRAMPGAVGLRHFTHGISRIPGSRWTGRESKETAKQLLPVVAGQRSIKPAFVSLVRSVLDFTYRAHKTQMSDGDLERLQHALCEFHMKKPVLVALGIYGKLEGLNRVKKLHMLTHYFSAICEMGTPDGYNTESPEHLHIIYAKRGWRASNKVRPLEQMVKFIQRYEALRIHRMFIDLYYGCEARSRPDSRVVYGEDEDAISEGVGYRLVHEDDEQGEESIYKADLERLDEDEDENANEQEDECSEDEFKDEPESELIRIRSKTPTSLYVSLDPEWSIAIKPTVSRMPCNGIIEQYGALDFVSRINEWLQESTTVGLLPALQFVTHDHTFDLWHKFYLHHRPLHFDPDLGACHDMIRAQPPLAVPDHSVRSAGPGKFDTVLFLAKPKEFGIHREWDFPYFPYFRSDTDRSQGYRAGRVRVIFRLPPHLSTIYSDPLVYLELFTPFTKDLSTVHKMHTVSHNVHCGIRRTIVIPLVWVVAACHLVPIFSQFDDDFRFDCYDVLSIGKVFFFNHYSSYFMFDLVDHWRAIQDKATEAQAAERRAIEEEAKRVRAARGKAARARLVQVRAVMDSTSH
ncbi:hypothetical protein FRC11_005836 [Ceratobasidium sp. 423]|nr:hypothetical protein FRC11_005836 [Ceratobasidium sp. 423]